MTTSTSAGMPLRVSSNAAGSTESSSESRMMRKVTAAGGAGEALEIVVGQHARRNAVDHHLLELRDLRKGTVAQHADQRGCAVGGRGDELQPGHQKRSVAGQGNDITAGVGEAGADGGRHRVAHAREIGRRQKTSRRLEAQVLHGEEGTVAAVSGEDRIVTAVLLERLEQGEWTSPCCRSPCAPSARQPRRARGKSPPPGLPTAFPLRSAFRAPRRTRRASPFTASLAGKLWLKTPASISTWINDSGGSNPNPPVVTSPKRQPIARRQSHLSMMRRTKPGRLSAEPGPQPQRMGLRKDTLCR